VTKDPRRLFSISRRRLYRWHGWLGLNLGLLLFVVCLSGTLAVVAYEIDGLLDPALRVEAATTEVDWTAVEQTVRETFPYHEIGFVLAPRHPGFAATVLARGPGGRWQKIYLHPQTGALQEAASYWNVQRFLRSFHRRFFLPQPFGVIVLTAFALFAALTIALPVIADDSDESSGDTDTELIDPTDTIPPAAPGEDETPEEPEKTTEN